MNIPLKTRFPSETPLLQICSPKYNYTTEIPTIRQVVQTAQHQRQRVTVTSVFGVVASNNPVPVIRTAREIDEEEEYVMNKSTTFMFYDSECPMSQRRNACHETQLDSIERHHDAGQIIYDDLRSL